MDGLYEQLRIALHQVWRRRWLALAVAWGVCLAGWLAVALIPNKYESKARVVVELQSILPTQVGIGAQQRQDDLMRVRQTLTSTANLEKVVRATDLNGLVASDRDLAAQVTKLREAITVTQQQDNLFEIKATASESGFSNAQNAKLAAAVVQNLLDLFQAGNVTGDREEATQSLAFLDGELKRREGDLQAAEQRRVEFEQRYMGLLPGEGSIEQRLAAGRSEMASLDQQLIQAQSSLTGLRGQLGSTPPTIPGVGGPGAGSISGQLSSLQGQLATARANGWTDSHPDVIALRNQIERLRPLAARESPNAGGMANPSWVSLKSLIAEKEGQVQAASSRKAQLQAEMNEMVSRQASEPGVAAELAKLNRDYDVLKRQYDKLLEDREQVRLRTDIDSKTQPVKFKVIDPPSQPTVPESPNRPLLLSAILALALAAGVGAAFVLAQFQKTFPTQARLADATGLPVLGAIGEVATPVRRLAARQRLVWLAGGTGALAAAWAILMAVEFWQRSTVA
ncbi:MAG: chain-length determining protein [Alphaproteobacteria bacterium]|nr:chain-length determining protein [Alphaproteobacteria bacterium]MBV9371253.1 chain-length determining protein [Alphaproteobacteria bacterium]MBV9902808.1 chain-length determining protein [Alphaproteobacteria bacterium]